MFIHCHGLIPASNQARKQHNILPPKLYVCNNMIIKHLGQKLKPVYDYVPFEFCTK